MNEQEKTLGLALELCLIKTQIINAFYKNARRESVEIVISDLSEGFAEVISFCGYKAGKHQFQHVGNHYELIEEFEL